jgi:HAD superfamily hydrolase (TIGR01549 family)
MFLNIADRWELSQVDRFMLLECNEQQFEEWSSIARSHGPLVLETAVLMRVSAVLGVFAELRHLFASADQERGWLTCVHTAAPFGRRAPLDLLRGSLEDQLAVRRYAESIERRVSSSNDDDLDSTPYRVVSEETRPQIRAVCFDGFGTLVDIGDRRRPFKTLLGDGATPDAVTTALTTPTSLRDLARDLSLARDEASLSALEADLDAELASTRLRPAMEVLSEALRHIGLRVGVCSNLAAPYKHALLGCFPRVPDALVLSFQVGLLKPQAEIYQRVCAQLGLEPKHVLFVGDRLEEDVLGPQRAGLFTMHIDEFESALVRGPAQATPSAIAELVERVVLFSREPRVHLPHSPEEALDSELAHVNVSTRIGYDRNQLLHVLRTPSAVIAGDDHVLKHLLCAFIDEADEALLIRIAEGAEVGWAELRQAAQVVLRPEDLRLVWIAAREIMSRAARH